jgi:predicted nucleotidyltransferase
MYNTRILAERGYHKPPKWLPLSIQYETQMGSVAYGVNSDTSDVDLYGFCVPPKDLIFPHLAGEIPGFGRQIKRFEQYQQHHIQSPDELGGKGRSYDVSMFSIIKFFHLAMENNPNMVDALFTPQTCVLSCTKVGSMVRERRRIFLHKGSWHKFKGYAYSQKNKMYTKTPTEGSNRRDDFEKHGFDLKAAYHCVRLMLQVEQILIEGDLDLMRHREQLKSIRRGEWTADQIAQFFQDKEQSLERLYNESPLRHTPDEEQIKTLLLECLEEHYGNLEPMVVVPDRAIEKLRRIKEICEEAGV